MACLIVYAESAAALFSQHMFPLMVANKTSQECHQGSLTLYRLMKDHTPCKINIFFSAPRIDETNAFHAPKTMQSSCEETRLLATISLIVGRFAMRPEWSKVKVKPTLQGLNFWWYFNPIVTYNQIFFYFNIFEIWPRQTSFSFGSLRYAVAKWMKSEW